MRKLLFILFVITVNVNAQDPDLSKPGVIVLSENAGRKYVADKVTYMIDTLTNFDTISATSISVQNLYITPPDAYLTFKDSAVVIAGGSNIQLTNSEDSLYRQIRDIGFTLLKGDTVQFLTKGNYNVFVSIRGYGSTGTDWQMTRALKRGSVVTYGNSTIDFSTTGGNNRNGGFMMYSIEALPGDKLWFVLSRTAGTGDFTIISSTWKVQLYYLMP